MKKIAILLLILMFSYAIPVVAMAQDDETEMYVVYTSIKVYPKDTTFSKATIAEPGTILYVDKDYEDNTFVKVYTEDYSIEGYVLKENLTPDVVSAETSDTLVTGDNTTASARGSRGDDGGLSFSLLNLDRFGDKRSVSMMERRANIINEDDWEQFRKEGGIGEYAETEVNEKEEEDEDNDE